MLNKVIKVTDPSQGAKVIEYFKTKGVDTGKYVGAHTGSYCYYGVIGDSQKAKFDNVTYETAIGLGLEIIELPIIPRRGDRILVWDSYERDAAERIFLAYIEGAIHPVQSVESEHEHRFKNNASFDIARWKNWKPIPKEVIVELTMQDISEGKGVGIAPHLIRIKK